MPGSVIRWGSSQRPVLPEVAICPPSLAKPERTVSSQQARQISREAGTAQVRTGQLHPSPNPHFCPPGSALCAGNSNGPGTLPALAKVNVMEGEGCRTSLHNHSSAVMGARAGMTRSPEDLVADRWRHLGSVRREGCLSWACEGGKEFTGSSNDVLSLSYSQLSETTLICDSLVVFSSS